MKTLKTLLLAIAILATYNIYAQVAITTDGSSAHGSAMLEVKSTTKGFLIPRMTTAERDLIQNPADGLHIFNTSVGCPEYYYGGHWYTLLGTCPPPSASTAGTHTPGTTQIVWNWNASAGATGYKWHTANNYEAATDLGNTTTVTQTELTCNTSCSIYVWAYNICGNSTVLTLTETTTECPFECGTSTVTFTYKGEQVTYGTVISNNKCWLDRNLGASQVAQSSTDNLAYGDLFQWGRRDDGHQTRTSETTGTLSNTNQPAHGDFILAPNSPYDWRSPQYHNFWQGVDGVNNPCPAGWRVPTEAEWVSEYSNWPTNNHLGAINSPLKLPRTGTRGSGDGWLGNVNFVGYYWSSTREGDESKVMYFTESNVSEYSSGRANGHSLRCITDPPPALPVVTTGGTTNITHNSATSGGNVTSNGFTELTARGVVYSTSETPTLETNEGLTSDGTGTGEFTSSLTGLTAETSYYVRAYATNSVGTAYGSQVSFTTGNTALCDALDNCNLTFTTGGDAIWFDQTNTVFFGASAVQSGAISDSQASWIETTVEGPGVLKFHWKVSSQQYSDGLFFRVNGELQNYISGTVDWEEKTYSLSSGSNTLKWVYSKDASNSSGDDAGWLDKLVFTPE